MKLLFDANLSWKLIKTVNHRFPGSSHVSRENLQDSGDREIWEYARENGFSILSKDHDFRQLSFLFGPPPRVIILSVGNLSTTSLEGILKMRLNEIESFVSSDEGVLIIQAKS
jgi:predicted nuclease of predicted toxin-antitoxin system